MRLPAQPGCLLNRDEAAAAGHLPPAAYPTAYSLLLRAAVRCWDAKT